MVQRTIFPRGGARPGAGRKPKGERAMVTPARRKPLTRHVPAHVTMRLVGGLPTLRSKEPFAIVRAAIASATDRFDFRIVHFSVQSNHVHLIVEARDEHAMGRGMKGLGVRMTRRLNSLWNRKGPLYCDRFHAEPLETPRQVRNALLYVLNNARRHGVHAIGHCDPYSSGDWFDGWIDQPCLGIDSADIRGRLPCSPPRSYLLRVAWRRYGRLYLHESPAAR